MQSLRVGQKRAVKNKRLTVKKNAMVFLPKEFKAAPLKQKLSLKTPKH